MKPRRNRRHVRISVRLRPGGLLIIRSWQLRQLGWSLEKDTLLYECAGDRVSLFKRPSETQWRIERLRTRLDPLHAPPRSYFAPRTLAEFLALKSSRGRAVWHIDVTSRHVTPVGGNVFEDLGFPPDEAKLLLAESDARVDESLTERNKPCV